MKQGDSVAIINISPILLVSLITATLIPATGGCKRRVTRIYKDKKAEMKMAAESSPSPSWQWRIPPGWEQKPGTGMRLATFQISSPASGRGECTMVALPGDGGGLEANVARWRVQAGLPVLSGKDLRSFLSLQQSLKTSNGLPATIIDLFSEFPRGDQRTGMLIAVVSGTTETLFVKFTAPPPLLIENRSLFLSFIDSLKESSPS